MTTRVKPVVKRSGRPDWGGGDRRTLLVNLGFTAAIVLSLLILVGYGAWNWYESHYGAAATVNGVTVTNDELVARAKIETFRIDYTESRIRTLQLEGKLDDTSASQQLAYLEQRRQSIAPIAQERLIDIELQKQLAAENGVTVSDAEIQARFTEEQTIQEDRHAWVIEVKPENDPATGAPGDAQKAAAKAKADAALADLKAGKSWDDVAKAVSTATSAPQAGDLGWITSDVNLDKPFLDAVFAAAKDVPTAVITGDDGIYRIGRVSEIEAAHVDPTYLTSLQDAKISEADYLKAVRADVVTKKLGDMVVADLSKPAPQRHVLQLYVSLDSSADTSAVKVRHILISPNHDPTAAQTLAETDPAWKTAEDEANAIYQEVLADPSKFDALAREKSDESAAKTTGGKLPYYDITATIDPAFGKAIFATGLKNGQILAPVRSAFGWHVIQFMHPYGDGDPAWMATWKQQAENGTDFAALARDNGEGAEAAKGGDIGWVAKGQLSKDQEDAIFATQVGGISAVVTTSSGYYLWKVVSEETRTPTADQIAIFTSNGFSDWYQAKKDAATITRASTTAAGG
jgi:parvulin-like peptidyl-prolyl isomerase